ncbi:MAG: hypothetical protein K2Q01_10130 [Rickettsiales bacterium]|nr:hypothetical protein [Rickettsiales bacterium]
MANTISLLSLIALAVPLCAEPAYSWWSLQSMSSTMEVRNSKDHAKGSKPSTENTPQSSLMREKEQAKESLNTDDEDMDEADADKDDDMGTTGTPGMPNVVSMPAPPVAIPAPVVSAPAPAPYMPPMR